MIDIFELKQRRRQLLTAVNSDAVVFLASAPKQPRNGDVYYPYRQNSDFYYLTAFPEPDAIALLLPDAQGGKCILFNRPHDLEDSIWHGASIGQEGACEKYVVDDAHPIDQLEALLPDYIADRRHYYWLGSQNLVLLNRIKNVFTHLTKLTITEERIIDLTSVLHEMRLRKSSSELACLRQAATISSQAHRCAMRACRPGLYEYQLEAELLYAFYQAGSRACAYPSIVASGSNACTLHYTDNNRILASGDLVLIDAGCEYLFYASDITRCFPVNRRFSPEQKAIYDIVLQAQRTVIALIKPGITWNRLQACCTQTITEGLLELGLLNGKLSSLIEQNAYKKFYMHGCSHWLGLDVHDVGSYKWNKTWRALEKNMVFTVEPGIYIAANTPGVPEKWWNIGVRIEDDVCVTETSCEVFSDTPKEIQDIESLMRS